MLGVKYKFKYLEEDGDSHKLLLENNFVSLDIIDKRNMYTLPSHSNR